MSKKRELQMLFSQYDALAARIDELLLQGELSADDRAELHKIDEQLDSLTEQIVDLEDTEQETEVGQWWVIPIKRFPS